MSKTINSPIQKWPGEVVICDPLSFPQVFAFGDGMEAVRALGETPNLLKARAAMLPGIIACVEEWKLEGFPSTPTPETFPATPVRSAAQLIAWLTGEISALFDEANEIPNA